MKWTKRLKWIRLSKIIIPIALAISLVFAGFTVYANEAENFVLRINNEEDVLLSLTTDPERKSGFTSMLKMPVDGYYEDVTFEPNPAVKYDPTKYDDRLPDDIATYDNLHSVRMTSSDLAFYSFSFFLVNKSSRAVDVDMRFNVDELVKGANDSGIHIDDAVRVMILEGDKPLISDNSYIVYKKADSKEDQEFLDKNVAYETVDFLSDICVFNREGDLGYRNLAPEGYLRFTVVIWLEGWDPQCIDDIRQDSLKMSIDFTGH